MKRIVLTFGIIAGLIAGGMFYIMSPGGEVDFDSGQLYGYISMTIALSTIFFAVKQYRDKHSNGTIKFGKAFLIGLYITLVAGLVYVLAWEVYYQNYGDNFVDQYVSYLSEKMTDAGKTTAEIDTELASTVEMMESYDQNMLMRFGLTFLEIFPVGLVISLICGLIFGVFLKDGNNDKTDKEQILDA